MKPSLLFPGMLIFLLCISLSSASIIPSGNDSIIDLEEAVFNPAQTGRNPVKLSTTYPHESDLSLFQGSISSSFDPTYVVTSSPNSIDVDLSLYAETDFVSIWQTDVTSSESSEFNQISLPLKSDGTYNFTVNWGDETSDTITNWDQPEVTHTYSTFGQYIVTINGTLKGWGFDNTGDRLKILKISQWGNLNLGNSGHYFEGAQHLVLSATDAPDMNGTTTLEYAFYGAFDLGSSGNMNSWDVSQVTNMSSMFWGAESFNQPLNSWDVSSVTDMSFMFIYNSDFNQPLNSWDVSQVTNMTAMFWKTSSFDQPLDSWDVSQVTDIKHMFAYAENFNQPLNSWDVSHVTDLNRMFYGAESFNQPLSSWNVSQVTDMSYMFKFALSFNQLLDSWDVSQVTTMMEMFHGASSFNQSLGSWNVSQVTDMSYMFHFSTLSTTNYDDTLIGWSQLDVQTGVTFDAGNSTYSTEVKSARDILTETYSWTISDGGSSDNSSPNSDIFSNSTDPSPLVNVAPPTLFVISSFALMVTVITKKQFK